MLPPTIEESISVENEKLVVEKVPEPESTPEYTPESVKLDDWYFLLNKLNPMF